MEDKNIKQDVIKKQTDFIESFQKMMGFENSQMVNTIINPINNKITVSENKIKSLESKLDTSCKENTDLRAKLEAYRKATEDSKALIEKRQHKMDEVLKAIGNICSSGG